MTQTTAPPAAPTSPEGLAMLGQTGDHTDLAKYADATRYAGEPKFDGWRILVHVDDDGHVHLYTRNAKEHTGKLPEIEKQLAANLPPGTWLDTEAIAMTTKDGKVEHLWNTVQSVLGSDNPSAAQANLITLVAFDLISHGGIDARSLPYDRRRELLTRVLERGEYTRVILSPQIAPTDDSLTALLAQGFEGMMIKDRKGAYRSGKRGWVKIKPQDTEDVVIMGFKPGENGFAGLVGAAVFGQMVGGELMERGRCSGMSMQTRQLMTDNPDRWIGTVIEIAHMGKMESGKLRHPQFKRRRMDKAPEQCEWTS